MRFSKWIGSVAALCLIWSCFQDWVFIEAIGKSITGMDAAGTNYGRPGKLHIYLSVVSLILFLLPQVWAKRINIFICAFNLAFAIRNYIIISMCSGGDCPDKKTGLYLMLISSAMMLVMSFLPNGTAKIDTKSKAE
jgi:hypothetical protein